MKTLNDYSIYCTEEQTKKAIEFGAPIEIEPYDNPHCVPQKYPKIIVKYPTAEQMMEWLRTKGFRFKIIEYNKETYWQIHYDDTNWLNHGETIKYKEATLAAIDAALKELEYLDFCNWKKENNKE